MHFYISAPHLTELVQIWEKDAGKDIVCSEISQLVFVVWIHLEIGLSSKGAGRWQRRGQTSNAISHCLPACNCRNVRAFSSYTWQTQQCSSRFPRSPLNISPWAPWQTASYSVSLGEREFNFYRASSWGTFPIDTPVDALAADHKPCHCNRSISAWRSRLG